MRHGKRVAKLGRTNAHRKAMLANMASSLIKYKRITTTVAKAKALRQYIEPLLTRSKSDTTHSRRMVFKYVRDKEAVKELFDIVSKKIADRNGGYTRILRVGNRLGDNAELCIIELVDYNEEYSQNEGKKTKKRKRRRTRRGGSGTGGSQQQAANQEETAEAKEEQKDETAAAEITEQPKDETAEVEEQPQKQQEEPKEEEQPKDEAEQKEDGEDKENDEDKKDKA